MSPYYIGLALLAGGVLPLQLGINATLAKLIDSRLGATTISLLIGTICLIFIILITRSNFPSLTILRAVPLWALFGGALGAFYLTTTIFAGPYLGSTLLIVLVIAGQMTIALFLDQYGLLGFPIKTLNTWRLLGVILMLISVILIVRN